MLKHVFAFPVSGLALVAMVATANVGEIRSSYAQELTTPVDLSEQSYTAWRDHILPKPAELDWQKIRWLTTLKDGVLAANDAGKPLLFWTMNGHPLGCT